MPSQLASLTTIPAPIGGLNVYDNYMSMPETDALKMVNLIPTPYGCTVRKGYKKHATGLGAPVNTVISHANIDGTYKLFAFAGTDMHDVTIVDSPSVELSGLVSSTWQSASIANSAGTHTVMFSGVDDPIWYHNDTIKRLVAGDGTTDATWSGVDPEKLIQGVVHQRRLWAVERDSTNGWYLAADSFYGVASFFDFGPFFKRGGYLAMLGTWSADVGEGSDDHLVAVSSEGEAAVFAGIDPSNAATWHLRGVFYVGAPPSGRRFMANVGGDLLLLTDVGVVSMGSVLMSNTVGATTDTAYSKKVQHLLNRELSTQRAQQGWELHFFPAASLLVINMPTVFTDGEVQLVANYMNQAWCTFDGLPSICWATVTGRQFFGAADGNVYESWTGNMDNADTAGLGGKPIIAECQQAYTYFGALGTQKQVGMYKPSFISAEIPGFKSRINYDFISRPMSPPSAGGQTPNASIWDTALWDDARWNSESVAFSEWRSASGIGMAASLHMAVASERETLWVGTDYTLSVGGPL